LTFSFFPRRWAFGQHKLEGTLIGIGLWAIAVCGIVFGWLGWGGYVFWIPLLLLGLLFVCLIGHFLLFELLLLPVTLLFSAIERLRNRRQGD
jgi:hypothetical protein